MPRLTSILFSAALLLATTLGPQSRPWAWGPALILLALSTAAALPRILRNRNLPNTRFLIFAGITAGWFVLRAISSPVADFRIADLLLLCASIGAFLTMTVITEDGKTDRIFLWTLFLIVAGNVAVVFVQIGTPDFNPIFRGRPVDLPTGFFSHHNECANFLAAAALLLAANTFFGKASLVCRIFWGTAMVAAMAGIYYTRSRGGILATGTGAVVFLLFSALLLQRSGRRLGTLLLIGFPFLLIAAGAAVYFGWASAQQVRFQEGASAVTDNAVRLFLLGISISSIALHPWTGGGSRSFSWECNQFWLADEHGVGATRPEFVHNELLQSVTDYGLIGGLLLAILLIWMVLIAFGRSVSRVGPRTDGFDIMRLGGVSAFAAMFVQSSFSFVFHLLPGIMLLGVCLARALSTGAVSTGATVPERRLASYLGKSVVAISGTACFIVMAFVGTQGSRVYAILGPASVLRIGEEAGPVTKADALAEAIRIWPQGELYESLAILHHKMAIQDGADESDRRHHANQAKKAYAQAILSNPKYAGYHVNLAGLLSHLGEDEDSEEHFRTTIALQGGLEGAYKGRFRYCQHLIAKGFHQLQTKQADDALSSFLLAQEVSEKIGWLPNDTKFPFEISLHEGLGKSMEATGDFEGALANYEAMTPIYGGNSGHFLAGALLSKMAESRWSERRPSEALDCFLKARDHMNQSTNVSDQALKPTAEHLAYLTERINFLTGAGIRPTGSE